MAEYKLNKTVYPKGIYENVIDTSFSQNSPTSKESTISVEQFFNYYNSIFRPIRTRTENLLRVKQSLYRLSYGPF